MNIFTEEELQELTQEIERQLQELEVAGTVSIRVPAFARADEENPEVLQRDSQLPRKQVEVIAQVIGRSFSTFFKDFLDAALDSICEKTGKLNQLWQKLGDWNNPASINIIASVLAGMGIAEKNLRLICAPLVAILIDLGIEALCRGYKRCRQS
ncbi:MAG: hypothetical protein AAFQ80_21445 [Cyanobacteria bacterium J06621_8]